ncbi:MAG: hypothetical protein HIU92_18380 [Proteobacteria bacterium]|nr:hypothetical protein [Pseudomonadota bacterium]
MTVWLSRQIIRAVHDERLPELGGASGIRDGGLNGIAFMPDFGDAVITTLTMAAGEVPDDIFVEWVRGNCIPKS